jgi:hypothetical protein
MSFMGMQEPHVDDEKPAHDSPGYLSQSCYRNSSALCRRHRLWVVHASPVVGQPLNCRVIRLRLLERIKHHLQYIGLNNEHQVKAAGKAVVLDYTWRCVKNRLLFGVQDSAS